MGAAFWREPVGQSIRRTSRDSVPAGRYRLHVTGTGPVRFSVPASGLGATIWRATGRLAVRDSTAAWTPGTGALIFGASRVTLTASSVVVLRLAYRATTYGEEQRACVSADLTRPGCTSEAGMYVRQVSRAGKPDAPGSFLVVGDGAGSRDVQRAVAGDRVRDRQRPRTHALVLG